MAMRICCSCSFIAAPRNGWYVDCWIDGYGDWETLLVDYEREHLQVQSGVLRSEAQGNWLQRSWRPVIMLAFTVVILVGMFTDLPMPEDTSRFWDLLEIGLGGYIVGRFRMRK